MIDQALRGAEETIHHERDNNNRQELWDQHDGMIGLKSALALQMEQKKGDQNTKDKQFITAMWCFGTVALGITVGALVTALGGNVKFDTDLLKKSK